MQFPCMIKQEKLSILRPAFFSFALLSFVFLGITVPNIAFLAVNFSALHFLDLHFFALSNIYYHDQFDRRKLKM